MIKQKCCISKLPFDEGSCILHIIIFQLFVCMFCPLFIPPLLKFIPDSDRESKDLADHSYELVKQVSCEAFLISAFPVLNTGWAFVTTFRLCVCAYIHASTVWFNPYLLLNYLAKFGRNTKGCVQSDTTVF